MFCDRAWNEALIDNSDGVLFSTPHYAGYAAMLVRLAGVQDDDLAVSLEDSYLQRARGASAAGRNRPRGEVIVIDHINVGVSHLDASRSFYSAALAPLGIEIVMENPAGLGFGRDGRPYFWISDRGASGPLHVAFASPDRGTVDAFYRSALAAGGRDNGAPGLRSIYHPSYYGAFVLDPDGNNIEAVAHGPV